MTVTTTASSAKKSLLSLPTRNRTMKKISKKSHPSNKRQNLKTRSKSRPLAASSAKTWPQHKAFKSPFKSRRFSHSKKRSSQPTLRAKRTTVSRRVTRHQSCISQLSINLFKNLSLQLNSEHQSWRQHRIAGPNNLSLQLKGELES
jgi:hypothetical protein